MADDISHAAILCSAGNDSTTGFGWVRGRVMPHIDRKGPHADMMRAEVARLSDEEWVLLRDDEVRAFPEESPQFDFCA